ncbi:hypothetical protein CLOM_g20773 [Closterium sp. NIES-68]|nr:hypothetical protein CLOM_g20773 [Closterium sp. NIES-68]GJP80001.1 hypothetical protein CLOP_g10225 [Closterium sp. NIES-67]GJP83497.1 hypothetical protein CLOP_g13643 [Closterium sp. NIES-67]
MAPLKLYTFSHNRNAYKALIAAEYTGAKVEVPPFEFGKTNKSKEFLAWNPIGKVPVLQTPDGPIFESNAIAKYVAKSSDKGLVGTSVYETALIDQWIDFTTNEIDAHLWRWFAPYYGYGNKVQEVEDKAKEACKRGLASLNSHLESNTFVVGNRVTLADIVAVSQLWTGYITMFTPEFMKEFPHVDRFWNTLINQPKVKKVIGEVQQVQAQPTGVTTWFEGPIGKLQAAAAPKAAEPVAKPAAAAADEGEEAEAPKPKAKNPLDLLPPSPMIMDAWKRLYSNTKAKDFREVAIKGFWDMYDPEGYSLWFCDYKFNEENTVKFVTLNKVSGFLQRMDLARKYAFAKMCILGPDDGPFVIKGVWLFRGPDVPQFVMDECYDCELYAWTKVDLSDAVQKERVSQYFEEPDEIDGLVLQEAKCFK